jgi:biotin carboxyl carrier protein
VANLTLAFAELLAGAVLLDAAIKGDTIANVITGKATSHPLAAGEFGSSTPAGGNVPAGSYTNPVPGASTGRIDQGVDYTLGNQGFVAPGRSKILIADQANSGWAGGGYIAAQLLDGPLAGDVYYIAEGISPLVKVGDTVAAGTQLGRGVSNPYNLIVGNIEAGWANPTSPSTPLAQSLAGYSGDQSAAGLTAGYSFSSFVGALGGIAGVFQGAGAKLADAIQAEFAGGQHPAGVP